LGQASSFTFEGGLKNGIPLVNQQSKKKKIEVGKVRFDKTIATSKERSKMEKPLKHLKRKRPKHVKVRKLETINVKSSKN
jgi:DNA mismatch repair protein MutS2